MENILYVKISYGSLGEWGEKIGGREFGEEGIRVFIFIYIVISIILDGVLF